MAAGAVGAVSALATAFPELVLDAVRSKSIEASRRVGELRAAIEAFPRHAALKHVLRARGVAINEDVRRPLRGLTPDERVRLDELLPAWVEPAVVR
jgi:dihydrodipicolinate synthase/N-acetylneuraminate lyase